VPFWQLLKWLHKKRDRGDWGGSLKDIMERAQGLNVMYGRFPSASSNSKASITIRGMNPNGTLILLDGRRLAGEAI